MPSIEIPDPLPPAIVLPRKVIKLAISQHVAEFGKHSLVERTWHWALHGALSASMTTQPRHSLPGHHENSTQTSRTSRPKIAKAAQSLTK